jgi:hypothetical protein
VPKIGVTKVGLVDKTLLPEPVLVVTPVPPRATGNVPLIKLSVDVKSAANAVRNTVAEPDKLNNEPVLDCPSVLLNVVPEAV